MDEVAGQAHSQQLAVKQLTPTFNNMCTTFNDICILPCVVWHLAHYLTRKDAAALALASPNTARALQGCLQHLPCCPRIVVVASGSKKLLDVPFNHNGQPYRGHISTGHAAAADLLREVAVQQAAKRKRTARITMQRRHNTMWLTGIAAGPSTGCSSSTSKWAIYLCDYATRGVLKYTAGNLSPLGVFASGAALANPEGITWVGCTCYVVSSINNTVVALGLNGAVQQVVDLPVGLMPWGLTAWDPARQGCMCQCTTPPGGCSRTAAAATTTGEPIGSTATESQLDVDTSTAAGVGAGSAGGCCSGADSVQAPDTPRCPGALFVAVDEEYYTKRYNVPPATATGGVVCVALSPAGAMLDTPQMYSKMHVKRPSGLCFDHAGHLWVTSMDRLLLRLAGPCHAAPGTLLQTVNLQDMLGAPVRDFYPFDVQAILPYPHCMWHRAAACTTTAAGAVCQGLERGGAVAADLGVKAQGNPTEEGTMLTVTLHQGPQICGAIASLSCRNRRQNSSGARGPAEGSMLQQEQCEAAEVVLLSLVTGHKCLKEPNMIAIM